MVNSEALSLTFVMFVDIRRQWIKVDVCAWHALNEGNLLTYLDDNEGRGVLISGLEMLGLRTPTPILDPQSEPDSNSYCVTYWLCRPTNIAWEKFKFF